jgi:uncharacterized protein (DUF58 family)
MRGPWWWLVGLLIVVSVILRQNLLFLMALLLALIGGASLLWARYCLAKVSYQRHFGATHLFYGDETTMDIEITNAKPLPLPWLRAEDQIPEELLISSGNRLQRSHRPNRRVLVNLLSLRWYERVTRHYRLRAVQRGAFEFGPAEISAEDIFGFAVKRADVEARETIIVYPRTVPLTVLGLPAQHPFGDYRTPLRVMPDPNRMMSVREYAPGDDIRFIHWKATARRTALQTKIFDPSASRPLVIFLNVNTYDHIWEGIDRALQELAITIAASVARYGWENGYSTGLFANSVAYPGGERVRVTPGTHPGQLTWILEALAKVVDYGRWPVEAVMETEAGHLPYGSTVIVISARVGDDLARVLLDLRRREHAMVLITVGEERLAEPPAGVVYYHAGHEVWNELESLQLA